MAHEFFNDDMLLPGDDIAIGSVHEKSFGLAVEVDLAEQPTDHPVVDWDVLLSSLNAPPAIEVPPPVVGEPIPHSNPKEAASSAAVGPSVCASPTQVTDSLLTPKSKQSKPKAVRATRVAATTAAVAAAVAAASAFESGFDAAAALPAVLAIKPEDGSAPGSPADLSPTGPPQVALTDEEKRQERMLRNRASAANSRKRKREQLTELEIMVQELKAQCMRLQSENAELAQKNAALCAGAA